MVVAALRNAASCGVSVTAGMTGGIASLPRIVKSSANEVAARRPVTTAFSVLQEAWPLRSTQSPHMYNPRRMRVLLGEADAEPTQK